MNSPYKPSVRASAAPILIAAAIVAFVGCGDDESRVPSNAAYVPPIDSTGAFESPAASADKPEEAIRPLLEARRQLDRTVWAPEVLAQRYELALVKLWDSLNAAEDQLAALAEHLSFQTLTLPAQAESTQHEMNVVRIRLEQPIGTDSAERTMTAEAFRAAITQLRASGYQLVMSDWHLTSFTPAADIQPARSTLRVNLFMVQPANNLWTGIEADIDVTWGELPPHPRGVPEILTAVVRRAEVIQRVGPAAFSLVLRFNPAKDMDRPSSIQPILIRDLDGNGHDDLALGGLNMVFDNQGRGRFEQRKLLEQPPDQLHSAALLADLTGDGVADFLCASHETAGRRLLLYRGASDGRFPDPPTAIELQAGPFFNVHAMTAADIDADGDLDPLICQYKPPSAYGQMPTPYFDSNDGFPMYLLRNDGDGRFTDITEDAGLADKRRRRVYSASLIDLNDDRSLDLVLVSDFRGADIFLNDGTGRFTDVTDAALPNPHAFGMAHTFDDYNLDGRIDFYMIGMTSFIADRIQRMGLTRPDRPEIAGKRPDMAYGNRLYLASADASGAPVSFQQNDMSDQAARTGWSWGAASFDLENDGDRDIYVANGNLTGDSVEDYCSIFWRHDLYDGTSAHDENILSLFLHEMKPLHARKMSWEGRQKNVLLLNQGGQGFVSAAFAMGIAFDFDARSTAAVDLTGDGLDELLVIEENKDETGQTLMVLSGRLAGTGHWLGLRFPHSGRRSHLNGVKVVLSAGGTERVIKPVTENGYVLPQLPNVVRFGLGALTQADWVEARFPDGTTWRLDAPAIDTYHPVAPQ